MTTTPRRRTICASPHEALGLHEGRVSLIVRPVKLPYLVGPSSGKGVREIVPSLLPNRGDLFDVRYGDDNPSAIRCPFGRVGDLLEFRETWAANAFLNLRKPSELQGETIYYRATYENDSHFMWRSAATMPRWAVRTRRTILDVRVKRACEITEEEAKAVGLVVQMGDGSGPGPGHKWDGPAYWDGYSSHRGWRTYHHDRHGTCCCYNGERDNLTAARCAFKHHYEARHGAGSWSGGFAWLIGVGGKK